MTKKLFKYLSLTLISMTTLALLSGCQGNNSAINQSKTTANENQIKVLSTIYPEYDFAKQIGKENVSSTLLIPPGSEAHHYEPTPQDLIALKEADVFVYTSEAMEPWVEKMLSQVGPNTIVVEASKGVTMLSSDTLGLSGALVEHEDDHDEDSASADEHEGLDPHIWLDPANAKIMAKNIADAMIEAKPELAKDLQSNYDSYASELDQLDRDYTETLGKFDHKSIMFAGHFAFGYMAHKWQIEIYSPYEGFSPDAEPSPQKVAEMIDLMKSKAIKTVYYEELIDPKIARVIANESGADLVMLHAAHNVSKDELSKGITYIEIMKANLDKLKVGFEK